MSTCPAPMPWSVPEPGARVALSGSVDVRVAADLRLLLADQVEQGSGDLVVDLAAVTALDATGLGLLVGAHRHARRAGRQLVLDHVPGVVVRLLHRTRLDRVIRHTVAAAL